MRKIEEIEIPASPEDGLGAARIISQALPVEKAEELLPETAEILGGALDRVLSLLASGEISGDDELGAALFKLAPVLASLAGRLTQGRLASYAGKLLAGTTIVIDDDKGEKSKFDLVSREQRYEAFDLRPDLYFRCLAVALKVTFVRFFPGLGRGKKKKAATAST